MSLNQPQSMSDITNDNLNDEQSAIGSLCLINNKLDINSNNFINNNNLKSGSTESCNSSSSNNSSSSSSSSSSSRRSTNNDEEEEEDDDNEDDDDDFILNGNLQDDCDDQTLINNNFDNKSKSSNNKNKDFICYMCKNKLIEPKLLNCLHVFCKNCLNEQISSLQLSTTTTVSSLSPTESLSGSTNNGYLNDDHYNGFLNNHHHHNQQIQHNHVSSSSSSSTTSSNHHSITSITCPLCKQETKLPLNGIDGLDDDYVMFNMLDMLAIEEMIIACTSCKAKEKAVARCADCSNFLCPNCVSAHQYMRCFENHRVVRFEDLKHINGNGIPIHKPLFCKYHDKECLKFYCNSCEIPICSDCTVSIHQQPLHNYERLNDVELKNIEHLHMVVNDAKKKINYCQDQFSVLDNYLADLQDQLETARGNIDETYQSYKAILEKRRDDMLKELEEQHAKKELLIMDMHNSIDKSINKITDVVGFTDRILKNGNNLEILLLKKHVLNQVQHIVTTLPQPNINVGLQFVSDKNCFEKAIIDYFGYFYNNDKDEQLKLQQQQQQQLQQQLQLQQQQQQLLLQQQLEQEQHQQQQQQQQQQLNNHNYNLTTSQYNHDDNLHQSPRSTEAEWSLFNMVSQKSMMSNGFDAQSPSSPIEQDYLNAMNLMSKQATRSNGILQPYDDQHSPESTCISNDYLMNMNVSNFGKTAALNSNQIVMNNLNLVQNHYTQRPPSPIDSFNNLILNGQHQNNISNVTSPSQTPGLITSVSQNGVDDFMRYNNSSMTQNLDQLTKLIAPTITNPTSSGPLSIPSTSPTISDLNQYAGNGNLNPPVRNVTMTHMTTRAKFGQLGSSKAQFNSPHGFCLGVDEEIIVADTHNHRIQVFDKTGEYKYHFGVPGREEGQLWYPRKVTVMTQTGKFVVCDRGNERSRMQIFSKNGHFIKKIGIRYIDIVAGLAITNKGHIVAVDSVSPTVFCLSESGDLLKWFDCSDQMREPSDIAIRGNEYYVCDFKGHCVCVFTEEGQFLRKIGSENITNFPNGIDVSDAGDVLVGDSHGNRFHVAVFSREGQLLSEFECPHVKVSRCCGLKITSEGYVVTLAKNNHHVLVLNTLYVS